MAPHELEHGGKIYRVLSVRKREGQPPICECQFLYKGGWHTVKNYALRVEIARRVAAAN